MELLESYEKRKEEIKNRLKDFSAVMEKTDEEIFEELVFCLLTPQSKARICYSTVKKLKEKGLLFSGDEQSIRTWMAGVRFPNEKTKHVVAARDVFMNGSVVKIKEKLKLIDDSRELREWLVKNVNGLGYKEASHFLRNIGIGFDLAILDRHIIKNLKEHGVIEEVPKSLTPKKYIEFEKKMKEFSERIGIPMAELDLLFWSMETGEIFK